MGISKLNKPNKSIQAQLRGEIEDRGITSVGKVYDIDTRTLARYLANLPMSTHVFRGIEIVITEALAKGAPSSRSAEGAEDGLRR